MVLDRLSWRVACPNHKIVCGSYLKRSLWTHKEVNLASHPVVGLVLQVGVAEKFPLSIGFESLDPLFSVSKQGPCFTAIEEDGGDKSLV